MTNIDIDRFSAIIDLVFNERCDRPDIGGDVVARTVIDHTKEMVAAPAFRQWLANVVAADKSQDGSDTAVALLAFDFAFAVGRRYGFTEWAEADNKPTGLERIEDEVEEVNRRG